MKSVLRHGLGMICALAFSFTTASAKVWRVNNNLGVTADFAQVNAAINNPFFQSGDTIYVEASTTAYANVTINKRVVIIGAGYLLSENTGLQHNNLASPLGVVTIDTLGSGSHLIGLAGNIIYVNSDVDNILISRSEFRVVANNTRPNSKMSNWEIRQSRISGFSFNNVNYHWENLVLRNNIFSTGVSISSATNGLARNNLFLAAVTLQNFYVSNNVFLSTLSNTFENCTIRYNISQGNNLPAGNNNQLNVPQANVFVLTGSTDARYQLAAGSPAIGAGEPVGGETPDIGPFGTQDPYRISGIPPIPTIYELTVPATVSSSATSMNITVSIRSNN